MSGTVIFPLPVRGRTLMLTSGAVPICDICENAAGCSPSTEGLYQKIPQTLRDFPFPTAPAAGPIHPQENENRNRKADRSLAYKRGHFHLLTTEISGDGEQT